MACERIFWSAITRRLARNRTQALALNHDAACPAYLTR
jgi:hypothetical protein